MEHQIKCCMCTSWENLKCKQFARNERGKRRNSWITEDKHKVWKRFDILHLQTFHDCWMLTGIAALVYVKVSVRAACEWRYSRACLWKLSSRLHRRCLSKPILCLAFIFNIQKFVTCFQYGLTTEIISDSKE